jgi:hypothetical protein
MPQNALMATRDDLRRICANLPGAIESEDPFGFYVLNKGKGKGFIWIWQERVEPKSKRVPNERVLAISTPGLAAKEVLLASNPDVYFTEPHYNGFPAILVWLEKIDKDELEDIVVEAWLTKAPKDKITEYEQANGPLSR